MKKLLKKRYFIPLAVVAVMAIGAVAAYAYFNSGPQQVGDTQTVGTMSLQLNAGGNTSGNFNSSVLLMPTDSSTVAPSGTPYVDYQTVTITNTGNVPENVWGQITTNSSSWDNILDCQIWDSGTALLSQPMSLASLASLGTTSGGWLNFSQSSMFDGPLAAYGSAKDSATLTVAIWLDSSVTDSSLMGQKPTVYFKAEGFQTNDTNAPTS